MKIEGISRIIHSDRYIYIQSLTSHLQNVSKIIKKLVDDLSTILEPRELEMVGVYHDIGKKETPIKLEVKNYEIIDHYPQHTKKWKDIQEVYSEINSTKHREIISFIISNHHGFSSEEIIYFCLFKADNKIRREIPKLLYLLKQADDICACSAKALIGSRPVEPRPFDEIVIERIGSDLMGLALNPTIREFEIQLYYEFYEITFEQLSCMISRISENCYQSEKNTSQLIDEIKQIAPKLQLYPTLRVKAFTWKT